jgi:hypothetical protein
LINTPQGPATLDEGERVNIDQNTGAMEVIPASRMGGQSQLLQAARDTGMRRFYTGTMGGMKTGGITTKEIETTKQPGPTPSFETRPNHHNVGTANFGPMETVVQSNASQAGTAKTPQTITLQNTPQTGVAPTAQTVNLGGDNYDEWIRSQGTVIQSNTPQAGPANTANLGGDNYDEIQSAGPDSESPPRTITLQNDPQDGTAPTPATITLQGDPPPTDPDKPPPVDKTPTNNYEDLYRRSISNLGQYAGGTSPYYRQARDYLRDQYGGRAAAASGALQQTAGQLGLSTNELMGEQAMATRQLGSEEAQAMSGLMQQQGQQAFQAASQTPGLAMAGAEYEQAKQQYADTQEWKEFEQALEYGDDATLAAAYEKVFGRPMTDTAMANDLRTYARSLRGQTIESGALDIIGKRLGLSTQAMQAVAQAIDAGYTDPAYFKREFDIDLTPGEIANIAADRTNRVTAGTLANMAAQLNLGTATLADISHAVADGWSKDAIADVYDVTLSDAQYNQVKDAGPLGERSYQRGKEWAATAMELGGEANYTAINEFLADNNLGTIDFTRAAANDWATIEDDIESRIAALGDDADPTVVAALSGMLAKAQSNKWTSLGRDFEDDPNLKTAIDAVASGYANQAQYDKAVGLGSFMKGWVETGDGAVALVSVALADEGSKSGGALTEIMGLLESGDSEGANAAAVEYGYADANHAAKEFGHLLTAMYQQGNGTLNDGSRNLLKQYGLYSLNEDVDAEQTNLRKTADGKAAVDGIDDVFALEPSQWTYDTYKTLVPGGESVIDEESFARMVAAKAVEAIESGEAQNLLVNSEFSFSDPQVSANFDYNDKKAIVEELEREAEVADEVSPEYAKKVADQLEAAKVDLEDAERLLARNGGPLTGSDAVLLATYKTLYDNANETDFTISKSENIEGKREDRQTFITQYTGGEIIKITETQNTYGGLSTVPAGLYRVESAPVAVQKRQSNGHMRETQTINIYNLLTGETITVYA